MVGRIECEVGFLSKGASGSRIVASVARVNHHRVKDWALHDGLWPENGVDKFAKIEPREDEVAFVLGDGVAENELDRVHHQGLRSYPRCHGQLCLSAGIIIDEADDVSFDRFFMESIKFRNAVGRNVAPTTDLDLLPLEGLCTNRAYATLY